MKFEKYRKLLLSLAENFDKQSKSKSKKQKIK